MAGKANQKMKVTKYAEKLNPKDCCYVRMNKAVEGEYKVLYYIFPKPDKIKKEMIEEAIKDLECLTAGTKVPKNHIAFDFVVCYSTVYTPDQQKWINNSKKHIVVDLDEEGYLKEYKFSDVIEKENIAKEYKMS